MCHNEIPLYIKSLKLIKSKRANNLYVLSENDITNLVLWSIFILVLKVPLLFIYTNNNNNK